MIHMNTDLGSPTCCGTSSPPCTRTLGVALWRDANGGEPPEKDASKL